MPDRAEVALLAATVALIPGIYAAHLPHTADLTAVDPADPTYSRAHVSAAVFAGCTVVALAYFGRSPLVLVVGGGMLAAHACGAELARRA